MAKSTTSEEKNKKENRVGTTALGHSVRVLFVVSSIAASIFTLNPIPVLATVALAYGNYEYNNRLGKKDKKNVEDKGPSPTNKVLWRVAVTAIGTILGGPIGFGIATALVATDFLSNGKLTEATNKISNGKIVAGGKDIAKAVIWEAPISLLKGTWNLTKTAWSKTIEAQKMSKRDVVEEKAQEIVKGTGQEQNGPSTPGETGQQKSSNITNLNSGTQKQAPKDGAPLAKAAPTNEGVTEKANTDPKPILGDKTARLAAESQNKGQSAGRGSSTSH